MEDGVNKLVEKVFPPVPMGIMGLIEVVGKGVEKVLSPVPRIGIGE